MISRFFPAVLLVVVTCVCALAQNLDISSITPAPNVANVALNANITVSFDQPVVGATLTGANVVVRGSHTGVLPGALTGGGTNTISFDATNNFKPGEIISITITKNLIGLVDGQGLVHGHTYFFTALTGAAESTPITFGQRNITYNNALAPMDTKAMDIENDGDMDLVFADAKVFGDETTIGINDGTGKFCLSIVGETRIAEMNDLDGDGDKDIVSSRSGSGMAWTRNDGGGVFTEVIIPGGGSTIVESIRSGDIDSDGDIDIVSQTGSVGAGLWWYENSGIGTFTARSISAGTGSSYSYTQLADVNGDGAMDIVAYRRSLTRLAWYENNGAQVFTEHILDAAMTDYLELITADLDDDGDIDILSSNENNGTRIRWFANDGNENFTVTDLTTLTSAVADDGKLHVVDLDGDLDRDVIGGPQWLENNGSEVFTPHKLGEALQQSESIDYADMDGDGDLDLVAGGSTLYNQMLWFENTKLIYVTSVSPSNGSHNADANSNITIMFDQPLDATTVTGNAVIVKSKFRGIVPGALSVSGNIITFNPTNDFAPGDEVSVAVTNVVRSPSRHSIEKNYGFDFMIKVSVPAATISFSTTAPTVHTYSTVPLHLDIADMDNDGDLDIVSSSASELRWHQNDGTGNFTVFLLPTTGTNFPFALTDVNRDGLIDIVNRTNLDINATVFLNDASHTFATTTSIAQFIPPISGMSDIDRDGYDDVLASRYYHYNCDAYSEVARVGSASTTIRWETGDFDNDGDIDLLRGLSTGEFHRHDGSNMFSSTTLGGGVSVAGADLDGDGDLDPIFAGVSTASFWYPNNLTTPSANFASGRSIAGIGESRAMVTADFDGDGDIDIAGAGQRFGLAVVRNRLNEATANFATNSTLIAPANFPFMLKGGDFNGDGKIDLVAASTTGNTIRFFPNTSASLLPPTITSISPDEGPEGEYVQIDGTNFSLSPSNNIVRFNGTLATVNSSTATRVVAFAPVGGTKGFVTVTVGGNTATSSTEFSFLPDITDVDPWIGPVGTEVTITGSRFGPESRVYFDGTEAVIDSRTSTTIVTHVPPGATTGYIEVHTSEGMVSTDDADFVVTNGTGPEIIFDAQPESQVVCAGTTVNLYVIAYGDTGLTFQWMYSPTASGPFSPVTGSAYSAANSNELSINTTGGFGGGYYQCEVTGDVADLAVSDMAEVGFTVVTPPTTTGSSACAPHAFTLTASGGSDGAYLWYTQSTGGTPIDGEYNSIFVTPELSVTTTYYVSISDDCESTRTPVVATIDPCNPPVITPQPLITQIGGIVTIDLIPLITTANLDVSSLEVVSQPASGAPASIDDQGILTIDYAGRTFTGSETVEIGACDLNGRCSTEVFNVDVAGEVEVYNAVSPEGKNPILRFRFIEVLPDTQDNKVVIYNRWGDVVFEVDNYNNTTNAFAGVSSNGVKLPSGTYYYKVTFGGGKKNMTGFLELRY